MALTAKLLTIALGWQPSGDVGPYTFYAPRAGKQVWFPRMPEVKRRSVSQVVQQERMRAAAAAWQELTAEQKRKWEELSLASKAMMTGYNLWVYLQLTKDNHAIETLIRQTGINPFEGG